MKKVLFVLFAMSMLTACKKETKVEKNLWKKRGEWIVTSWTTWNDGVETELMGTDIQSVVFTFQKEKDAIVTITGSSGDSYSQFYNR